MPQPIKQSATTTKRPTQTPKSDDLFDQIVPVEEIDDEFLKIVVYGRNRVGKTTIACQFPKPLLLIALEPNKTGGALSVKKVPGVSYLRLTEKAKVVRLATDIAKDPRYSKFKTVVLDSVTSLQDIILKEILNLPDMPEILGWGTATLQQYRERSEVCREVLRPYLNLDKHVVILGKERDHTYNEEKSVEQIPPFIGVDLGKATAEWINDACDYICQMQVWRETKIKRIVTGKDAKGNEKFVEREEETGRTVRRLRTMAHPNYMAGFRAADPSKLEEFIIEPTFAKIYKAVKGE